MGGALPNLIIIGAMKCGTTSLHSYLARHPDVGMSDPKEINFFSGEYASQGLDWYMSHFNPEKKIRGESSQSYSKGHHPQYSGAPGRIHELVPGCQLIYLVRDPIERYQSHLVENYLGDSPQDVRWNIENDHYVKTGLYYYQLQFFLQYFRLEQIMVVDQADLKTRRLGTMNDIFAFLGLDPITDPAVFDFEINANGEEVVPYVLRRNYAYRAARRLAPAVTDRGLRNVWLRRAFLPGSFKKPLSDRERARLAERFRPDCDALRRLLNRPFPNWSV